MAKTKTPDKERRISTREKVLVRAAVVTKRGGAYEIPCILKEMSDTGCQIVGTMVDAIEGDFYLKADVFATPRACAVIRRSRRVVGARFRD